MYKRPEREEEPTALERKTHTHRGKSERIYEKRGEKVTRAKNAGEEAEEEAQAAAAEEEEEQEVRRRRRVINLAVFHVSEGEDARARALLMETSLKAPRGFTLRY